MSARSMHSARPKRKKYGTDINRYLGVELPEDRIHVPAHSVDLRTRPPVSRNGSSAFSFRDSLAKMFSTASTVNDMAKRQSGYSGSVRRWKNKSASSARTAVLQQQPATPLRDRTNTMKTSSATSASGYGNNTSFLPELNSTPPMPTFQKPAVPMPMPRSAAPRPPAQISRYNSLRRPDSEALPPISDPGRLLGNPGTKVGPALVNRVEETPPLPGGWTEQHDRAICVLDARNYPLHAIVMKVRRTFPGLRGLLTPGMVDKRLRQLDQNVEIDYWRVGLLPGTSVKGGADGVSGGAAGEIHSGFTVLAENAVPSRVLEPTLKTTTSGSLVKSQSNANLLPDTMSMSSEPATSTTDVITSSFTTGYRPHAI